MASIFGVSLKGITKFKGHEGEPCYQGNIYLDGRRIGEFSDDSWGGSMRISVNDVDMSRLQECSVKYRKRYPFTEREKVFLKDDDIELFIPDILLLLDREKEFKKLSKKGSVLLAYKIEKGIEWRTAGYAPDKAEKEKIKQALLNDGYTDFYFSLDDFIIQ